MEPTRVEIDENNVQHVLRKLSETDDALLNKLKGILANMAQRELVAAHLLKEIRAQRKEIEKEIMDRLAVLEVKPQQVLFGL